MPIVSANRQKRVSAIHLPREFHHSSHLYGARSHPMPTCADVLAATLRDAGVERMFGLPGGEILDFIEAARKVGIEFILVRHEAVAAFMADAAGQIARKPAVCVSTLGPGAMNLTLGVANALLDRSPLIAITATMSTASAHYA